MRDVHTTENAKQGGGFLDGLMFKVNWVSPNDGCFYLVPCAFTAFFLETFIFEFAAEHFYIVHSA